MKFDIAKHLQPIEVVTSAMLGAVRTGDIEKAKLLSHSVFIFLSFMDTIDTHISQQDSETEVKVQFLTQLQKLEQELQQIQSEHLDMPAQPSPSIYSGKTSKPTEVSAPW